MKESKKSAALEQSSELQIYKEMLYAEIELNNINRKLKLIEHFLNKSLYGKEARQMDNAINTAKGLLHSASQRLTSLLPPPETEASNAK